MMTRDDFIKEAKAVLMEMLPEDLKQGLTLDAVEITKSNDQKLHGLTFKREDSEAAPTIYLDDAYGRFTRGEEMHALVAELKDAYMRAMYMPQPSEVDFDLDHIQDKLTLRLLEIRRNRDYLSQTPYMTVGHGLAMVCDIKMDNGTDIWRATVTQAMMDKQNYDKRELFISAMDNAQIIDPPVMVDMSQAIFGRSGENLMLRSEPLEQDEKGSMYVLTNESGSLGSAVLFYPETREHIADLLEEGYCVLPSSQHEVLIVPDSTGIDTAELNAMVKQANREVVEPKDVLSDNVYHYDRGDRRFEIASVQAEKGSQVAEAGRW